MHRLGDDLADRHARIERGVGILEDHLHLLAHGDQLARGRAVAMSTPSKRISPRGRIVEAQHEAAEGRLAAAGLADQAERLAAA